MASARPDPIDTLDQLLRTERFRLAELARLQGLDAESSFDCLHEACCTFLQLALRNELPPDSTEHPGYLRGIVKNLARNWRRHHHRARPHLPLAPEEEDSSAPSLESLLTQAEEHLRLRACVARLCDTQRAVVTLRLLEEQDGKDVADALGISRAHVDVLLYRAKGRLLACMIE